MKIIELDLYTSDLEATKRFYVSRLCLPMVSQSTTHLTVLVGWTRLTFRLVHQPVAPYHLAINVPHDSLEVLMYYYDLDFLSTQAPGKTIADFPAWQARSCYFYDATGNLLEFIARTDLNLNDPNLTFPDLIQGISEVGVPTEDVPYTSRLIQQRFGVEQFSKSTLMSDFNALGTDTGLFILSKVGRNWLFTDTPAGLTYCRVRFTQGSDGTVHELYSYEVNRLPISMPGSRSKRALTLPVNLHTFPN